MKGMNKLNDQKKPVVSVFMITYNQEKYIAQAIESVLMQNTNFDFNIFIGEDCSTDRTREICLEYKAKYPEKIHLLLNERNNDILNSDNTFKACFKSGAKYVAMLEGDDYWTDPLKLQKQVDLLEKHPECSGSFHETQQVIEDRKIDNIYGRKEKNLLNIEDTISPGSPFHTSSFVFRNIIKELPEWYSNIVSCDMALFSIVAAYGPIVKIPEIMSVYRKLATGLTNTAEIINNLHSIRINLIRTLNQFHNYKFDKKVKEVIDFHINSIVKEKEFQNRQKHLFTEWRNTELPENVKSIVSMISLDERKLLFGLAKNYWHGIGAIIDAGCFLGGSTLSLGMGVLANKKKIYNSNNHKFIHTYDLFTTDDHQSGSYLKKFGDFHPGDSFRTIFDKNTLEVSSTIIVSEGDFNNFHWNCERIEILFIDIAKSWELNDHIIKEFFPYLIPNHSIIIQQDLIHPTCPWLAITMEFFSDYFELVDYAPYNSIVYRLKKEIPVGLFNDTVISKLPNDTKLMLMDRAVNRFRNNLTKEELVELECARAILKLWLNGVEAAKQDLNRIKKIYAGTTRLSAAAGWVEKRILESNVPGTAPKLINDSFLNPELSLENMDKYIVRTSILKALKAVLPEFKDTLLDLGCGEMPYRDLILANSKVNKYIGLDIENPLYQQQVKPDLFWNGERIPLENNNVDCVMATEVLEHIPYPEKILDEIRRVLKPEGILFLTVPFIWSLHTIPNDEYRYTPFALERMLKKSGFENINLKPLGGWDASLAQVIGLWVSRKPMNDDERKKYSENFFSLYKNLIEADQIPEKFTEGQLITGLSGTAVKSKISNDEKDKFIYSVNDEVSLAIFTPNLGTLSETFIKKHIQYLAPGGTVVVTGNIFDKGWVDVPILQIQYGEGPAVYSPQVESKVESFLKENNVTHILVEYGCYGTEIIELNDRKLKLPIFVHFHGGDAAVSLRKKEMVEYYKWMGKHVTGVITVAKPMSDRLINIGIPAEKIIINHYGIEVPENVEAHPEKSPCRFVFVGRMTAKKAPDLTLKAFAKAYSQVRDIQLDLIGDYHLLNETTQLKTELEKFVLENNLQKVVTIHGAQSNEYVKNILNLSSVYVQHSVTVPESGDAEGLPNTILEASAHGLPVISTFHEGIPEEVENFKTGLLCNEFDVDKMAEYMITLAKHPALRRQMGLAGRQKIEKEFLLQDKIESLRKIIFSVQEDNSMTEIIKSAKELISKGRLEEAKDLCYEILSEEPLCDEVYFLLGEINYSLANYEFALSNYNSAFDIDCTRMAAAVKIIFSNIALNRNLEAIKFLKKVIIDNPYDQNLLRLCRELKVSLDWEDLKDFSNIRLYAGDIPEMDEYKNLVGLSITKKNYRHINHDVTKPFPIKDNSVDSFQSEDVFEHIPYEILPGIINEIYRILKPGATFRLSVPDYGCDILYKRSTKDVNGKIIFDPDGGGTIDNPGHLWFPNINNVRELIGKTKFARLDKIDFLHHYNQDGTFQLKQIDYSRGYVKRNPDNDSRVQNPKRPMSLIVDLTKSGTNANQSEENSNPVLYDKTKKIVPQKLSFVMIVLNGMPFIEFSLKAIYNFAHEIVIVEGAVEKCLFAANLDGSSRDNTVELIKSFHDPSNKIRLIQGIWSEKMEMQNKALEYISGDYVWLVDSDEVYKEKDIETILNMLMDDPTITQINFIPDNFWKGFDYLFVSPFFFENAAHYRRLFKYEKGARFTSHRPPTLFLPGLNKTTEEIHTIDGIKTREMGIFPYHYSYVFKEQVSQKIELYNRYGWGKSWNIDLNLWFTECYLKWTPENRIQVESQYPVWTGGNNSRTQLFQGEHPEVIKKFITEYNFSNFDQAKNRYKNKLNKDVDEISFIEPKQIFSDSLNNSGEYGKGKDLKHSDIDPIIGIFKEHGFPETLDAAENNTCDSIKHIENIKSGNNLVKKKVKVAGESETAKSLTQIDSVSVFAKEINKIISEIRPTKIIETGTFHGTGTTTIIASALKEFGLNETRFFSIEVNKDNHLIAAKNIKACGLDDYVILLNGLSVPRSLLPSVEEIEKSTVKEIEFDDIFVDHKENERARLYYNETNFENVDDGLLEKCLITFDYEPNFVLLDSGGHIGNLEFNFLIDRIKKECIIGLDDINHIKHRKSLMQIKSDPRFEIITSSDEKFGFCIAKFLPSKNKINMSPLLSDIKPKNILFIRTDAVGDNVLASSILKEIKAGNPASKITVLCQNHITELYEHCPYIKKIIGIDKKKFLKDEEYKSKIILSIRNEKFDLVINSVFSSEPINDIIAFTAGSKHTIRIDGNSENSEQKWINEARRLSTFVINSGAGWRSEVDRHRDFLNGLGIKINNLIREVWLGKEDEKYADNFFIDNGLSPEKTIILFAGARIETRLYNNYGKAMEKICRENNFSVVAVGAHDDFNRNQNSLNEINAKTFNLCGRTTLRQTAALIKKCRLVVGAETGNAHLACALGTPNVIILGGGHFGRFMPYSKLTTAVCLPMDCYGCDWYCKFECAKCVAEIDYHILSEAIIQALQGESAMPTIFIDSRDLTYKGTINKFIKLSNYNLIDSNPSNIIDKTEFKKNFHDAAIPLKQEIDQDTGCRDTNINNVESNLPENDKIILNENLNIDFTYSKRKHFESFIKFGDYQSLDIDKCDLKAYQDLLVYNLIKTYIPKNSKLLEIGGGNSRVIEALKNDYECWNIDKFEGNGNGPTKFNLNNGVHFVLDYMGNFNSTLPDNYFDCVYSISTLEHVPENDKTFENILKDMNRVLKPDGFSFHCFDVVIQEHNIWTNEFLFYLFRKLKSLNNFIPLDNLRKDDGIFMMSKSGYEKFWQACTGKTYEEFGKPVSYNIFWQKRNEKRDETKSKNINISKIKYPKISIVTPSFNQGKYLDECIDSILSQNYPNLEYIIMDGGSKDGSVATIKKYERYLTYWQSQSDNGQYYSIQEGLNKSSGEIMTWLNSDDKFHPNSLFKVANLFETHPAVEWICGRPTYLDDGGRLIGIHESMPVWKREDFLKKKYDNPFIQQESTFWKRSLWNKAGGYLDPKYSLAGDLELWIRFFRYAVLCSFDALIGGWRRHDDQKSSSQRNIYIAQAEAIIENEVKHFSYISPAILNNLDAFLKYDFKQLQNSGLNFSIIRGENCWKHYQDDITKIRTHAVQNNKIQIINLLNSEFELSIDSTESYIKSSNNNSISKNSNLLPAISVITPSFNQGKFIEQTIQSVLNQNYPNFEHIIIDGGSSDGTIEILKKYPHLKWVSEKDNGQSDALNKGFGLAAGDIIAWINSDDWYEPNTFITVAKFFKENQYKNIVMGDCNLVDENGKIFNHIINAERGFEELNNYKVARSIPTQPAVFFRKKLLEESGLLDINLKYVMDYDLWMRFAKKNRFFHINQTFANYRFHKEAKIGDSNWEKIYPECEEVQRRYASSGANPMVSVIIPCYNYAQYLPEAVESVINQTYKNFEIIIINDGSTDNTKEVAEDLIINNPNYKIKLVDQPNSGKPAIARNNGINVSAGSYILPLDADDKIPCDALEKYVRAALKINNNNVIVYGWMQKFGNITDCWKTGTCEPNRLLRRTPIPSSSLFHRSVWERNEGYATNVGYEDWDFWIGAAENGAAFINLSQIVMFHRETGSISRQIIDRKQHEFNIAGIISNHPNIYEPEELQWSIEYLAENSESPLKTIIHGAGEKFPLAVSLLIINYPELYTKQEIEWSISFLKRSTFQFLKGIPTNGLPPLTIISVNYNTKEWIKLLVEKVNEFTRVPYELIIVDNGSSDGSVEYLESLRNIRLIKTGANLGHGPALDYGFLFIRTKYAIVIDSDAHPIHPDWVHKLISPLDQDCLISGIHHHRNYAHPACLALKVKTFYKYRLTFKPNWPKDNDIKKLGETNWDAGEYLSMKVLASGKKINLIPLSKRTSKSIVGSEYGNIVYHNFYATRLKTNEQKEFDGIKRENIEQYTGDHLGSLNSAVTCANIEIQELKEKFRLSVVITTYNRIKLLEKVLIAFENQTAAKDRFEVIIIDDGSSPKAAKCVNNFKNKLNIKYIYHENKGLSFSRNQGIENSKYEIIAFADDDDIPSPNYVEEHLNSHIKYPDKNIAVLGKLEWDSSVQITPFMDYITRITGDYLTFDNLIPGQFYDVWKWWGGLISCKKELIIKYKPAFDERFTFGHEDTDLAIRMMNDNIKVVYNAAAKSYIIKKIEVNEYLNRKIKQGKSLFLLEQKHGDIVTGRYFTGNAYNEFEAISVNLDIAKNKIDELEKAISKLPLSEQIKYLNNNPKISGLLYNLYSLCIRGYLLKGYNENFRRQKIKFNSGTGTNKKLTIGLHAQTLYRQDNVVSGSEITTKGLKKAFEKYENVDKVIRYGSYSNLEVNEKLDLVIIEGWESDVPQFIEQVKKKNSDAIILFWNLSFWGLENIIQLPVDGFLTNSDKLMTTLQKYAPVKKVLLAADVEEFFPIEKVDKYTNDVVYLGMYHPHKSEEIISRMLIEAGDFNFAIYGKDWDSHLYLKKYWKGKLPLGEINALYSSAKIVIGTTEDRQREAGMINNRVFEALACGATFISEYFPELESTFGDMIFYSKQAGDTKKIISDILGNKIKGKGKQEVRDFIVKNHTYDQRVKDIFDFYFEIVNKYSKSEHNKSANRGKNIKNQPFISICIPTYNRAQFLSLAIQSALNQNYQNYEILIIDDGSTDNTGQIVKEFASQKIRYIKKENEGRPKTRNKLIHEAKGDYILWLDDDDILAEELLPKYSKILQKDPTIDVIYGNLQLFDSSNGNNLQLYNPVDYSESNKDLIANLISGSGITFPGSLIKKSILQNHGGFNEEYLRAQDNEFWARIGTEARFYKIDYVVCRYRQHQNNISLSNFVDRSYESMTIRKILSAYPLHKIFPYKDFNEALFTASIGLYNFGDYFNSANILRKINPLSSPEKIELYFNCQLNMGNFTEAESIIKSIDTKINDRIIFSLKNKIKFCKDFRTETEELLAKNDYAGINYKIREYINNIAYNFDAAFLLGSILAEAGQTNSAFDYLSQAIRFNPLDEKCFNAAIKLKPGEKENESLMKMKGRLLKYFPLFSEEHDHHEQNNELLPLISVIVPTFNRKDKLEETLQSILSQAYENFEIIVVNDAGEDIKVIIESYRDKRIKYFSHEINKGLAAARNTGIKNAKGKYIALLDDDDIFYPNHLQVAINNLDDVNKVIYTDAVRKTYIKDGEKYILESETVPYSIDYDRNKLIIGNIAAVNCFVFEKSLIDKAGYFDENLPVLEDWEFWLRLSEITNFKHIKENTVQVNWYNDGSTLTSSKAEEFGKTRDIIYKKYELEINKIPNLNDIVYEFNSIWQNDNQRKPTLVSIIALTFNQLDYTKAFVDSVFKNTRLPFELIIVDNRSKADTVKYLKKLRTAKKNVKVILNKENLGFPKGVNQAIKISSGNYIVIANNDIIVTKGWLNRLIELAEKDKKVGLVGPISNSVSGVQFDKNAGYKTIEEMHVYAAKVCENNKGKFFHFPRVAFLCTLIKKEVINKIGGLDERFSPGNFEDDDFCLRAQLAGYKTIIAQDVFIHHFGSKSFIAGGLDKYQERLDINKKTFVDKWGADPEEIWLHGKPYLKKSIEYPLDHNEVAELVKRVQLLIKDKEYSRALDYLVPFLEDKKFTSQSSLPNLNLLFHLAGKICLFEGSYGNAIKYFEAELNYNKQSIRAYKGLGDAYSALGDESMAHSMYEKSNENILVNNDN
jgi:glycosyltransferase involved in cell wall biosynthesis/ADP-heptose:LPS heptosyltransferase/ubiquinone/menaquinone biosynthesis C-methylase UbiE